VTLIEILTVKLLLIVKPAFSPVDTSDCNPGIDFSIPGSGIKQFVIPGSRYQD